MVVHPNEPVESSFAIVANRAFLLDEFEAVSLQKANEFAEGQGSCSRQRAISAPRSTGRLYQEAGLTGSRPPLAGAPAGVRSMARLHLGYSKEMPRETFLKNATL